MSSVTMCDGRVDVFGSGGRCQKHRHHRHGLSRKFRGECRECLFKDGFLPFGERKTCLQVALLMVSTVKSAFVLLLTKVTKPLPVGNSKGDDIFEKNNQRYGRKGFRQSQ